MPEKRDLYSQNIQSAHGLRIPSSSALLEELEREVSKKKEKKVSRLKMIELQEERVKYHLNVIEKSWDGNGKEVHTQGSDFKA